jgi:hypothetical protein
MVKTGVRRGLSNDVERQEDLLPEVTSGGSGLPHQHERLSLDCPSILSWRVESVPSTRLDTLGA